MSFSNLNPHLHSVAIQVCVPFFSPVFFAFGCSAIWVSVHFFNCSSHVLLVSFLLYPFLHVASVHFHVSPSAVHSPVPFLMLHFCSTHSASFLVPDKVQRGSTHADG